MRTPANAPQTPALAFHKAKKKFFCRMNGKFVYFGGDPEEARRRYELELARWFIRGCKPEAVMLPDLTISELADEYAAHLEREHEGRNLSVMLKWLGDFVKAVGPLPCAEFGPLALRTYRESLCDGTLARKTVNRRIQFVKALFRWGGEMERIPGSLAHGLGCVKGMRRGKAPGTTEPEPVKSVPWEHVAATLPHLPRPLRELVLVLWHTGARVGELLALRSSDLDRSGPVWTYTPREHKTSAYGHTRVICFGPEAQKVLTAAMLRHGPGAYLFPPRDAIAEWAESCPTHRRPDQKPNPNESGRTLGDHYRTDSVVPALRRAIGRCNDQRKAEGLPLIPSWHLHQLRHAYASRTRQAFGIEAARAALGHKDAGITLTYAEMDKNLAATVAAKIG